MGLTFSRLFERMVRKSIFGFLVHRCIDYFAQQSGSANFLAFFRAREEEAFRVCEPMLVVAVMYLRCRFTSCWEVRDSYLF